MKANYRPKFRNGVVARRPVKGTYTARAAWTPQSRYPHAIWVLVAIGVAIAGGFIVGLRWQLRAHYIGREDIQLRSELDRATSEQRYLALEQFGALSPRELENAANKLVHLYPPKLDDPSAIKLAQASSRRLEQARARERRERSAKQNQNRVASIANRISIATVTERNEEKLQ